MPIFPKYLDRGWTKKSTQGQNFAINEKSTIVVQSLRNLVKIFISWVLYVASISAGLDQNCGFFINSKVLGLCTFFLFTLYDFIHQVVSQNYANNIQPRDWGLSVLVVIRSYLISLYKSLKARVLTCTISLLQLLLFSVCIVLPTPQSNWFSLCLISQLKSLSISDQSPILTILKYQIQFC